MPKTSSFTGIWHKKQRSPQDCARHSFFSPPLPSQMRRNFAAFPFLEAPGKVPGRLLVLALRRAQTHFFPEKISDKQNGAPLSQGARRKVFLVT